MAGLRSAEFLRLKWEQVNWPESVIEIQARLPDGSARLCGPWFPPPPNGSSLQGRTRPVIGQISLYEAIGEIIRSAGVPWKQNALRHSFCSYRMATLKDAPRVSYEAGNSVRMIQRHYDKVVTESQGKLGFPSCRKSLRTLCQWRR